MTLEERLSEQEAWTFRECVALAAEYGTKPRVVIVTLLTLGKEYIDNESSRPPPSDASG